MTSPDDATPALDRRELLAAAGIALGAIGAFASLLSGCSPPDEAAIAERLRAALRELAGDDPGARLIAKLSGMTPEVALRTLREDVSNRRLYTVTSNRLLLDNFVEARVGEDLRAGRTRRIRGWWVAETEVAVAVLSGA